MADDTDRDNDTRDRRRTLDTAEISALGDDACIDSHQLGALTGASTVTLTQQRARGEGPPFIRLGRTIRYRMRDVRAWLAAHTVGYTIATRGGGR